MSSLYDNISQSEIYVPIADVCSQLGSNEKQISTVIPEDVHAAISELATDLDMSSTEVISAILTSFFTSKYPIAVLDCYLHEYNHTVSWKKSDSGSRLTIARKRKEGLYQVHLKSK